MAIARLCDPASMLVIAEHLFSLLALLGCLFLVGAVSYHTVRLAQKKPSQKREWADDQKLLPYAEFSGDTVRVQNIRHFAYKTVSDYTAQYDDVVFDLRTLKDLSFIIEPFSSYKGVAHTLLSFGFTDGKYLSLSVEIRNQKGDIFSAFSSGVRGLLKQYELMYVLADERDTVNLRANYRKDSVFLYPLRTDSAHLRDSFVSVLTRANALREHPEFYHTLTSNCTTNLFRHVEEACDKKIPWSITHIFPRSADRFLYKLGLLDTGLSFDQVRAAHRINELARVAINDPEFSLRIRGK